MVKNEVALLGGGFNPIGIHHQKIAQTVWREMQIPTWFMPCYGHRFAKNDDLVLPRHRWNMVTEVTENFHYMKSCDWEMAHEHNGSMFETIQGLTKLYLNTRFHIVIGMDNANVITNWDKGANLIKDYPFIVLQRAGEDTHVDWFQQEPHHLLPFNCPASSSAIRKAILEGDYAFAQEHLHKRVWEYIVTGRMYGYKTKD